MSKTEYQTRTVLAGAYRGKGAELKSCLSHLVEVDADGIEIKVVCRGVKLEHITDEYASDATARPTCLKCAAKFDSELNAKNTLTDSEG